MRTKKMVCFFNVIFLFLGLICSVDAFPDATVSFRSIGVTIDLIFPEEALPNDSIWHNATVTANTALYLRNLTVVIKAPVNSSWQVVFTGKDETNRYLSANATLQWSIRTAALPQETNGKLSCFMLVNTSQSADYSSYTFYTTHVSKPTFSEMQILYNEMLANYTMLQANYTKLLNDFNGLLANYTSLSTQHTTLLSEHNQLLADYNSKVASYNSLLSQYSSITSDYNTLDSNYRSQRSNYNALQSDYYLLNSTHYGLQANYTSLEVVYATLNQTYTELEVQLTDLQQEITKSESALDAIRIVLLIFLVTVACLIAFIIYIKRKKPEPYLVIRKETVSMKPDEKS